MKRAQNLFLLLFSFILFTHCCSDDEGDSNPSPPLEGMWHLSQVSGGFQPHDMTFDRGEVIWIFDIDQQMLEVENNLSVQENTIGMYPSGNYPFRIMTASDYISLIINENALMGEFILSQDTMILDASSSDGFRHTFIR